MSTCKKSSVYTRTGDKGTTSLISGQRASKTLPVFEALGNNDELTSAVGLSLEYCKKAEAPLCTIAEHLRQIQCHLQDANTHIATPDSALTCKSRFDPDGFITKKLENWIDSLDECLPKLTKFVLPSGGLESAHLHMARTICRRAERSLHKLGTVPAVAIFLNRLSDYLILEADSHAATIGRPASRPLAMVRVVLSGNNGGGETESYLGELQTGKQVHEAVLKALSIEGPIRVCIGGSDEEMRIPYNDHLLEQKDQIAVNFRFIPEENERITVRVKMFAGQQVQVAADRQCTVLELRQLIQKQQSIPLERYQLFFAGHLLADHQLLAQVRIDSGSSIDAVLASKHKCFVPACTDRPAKIIGECRYCMRVFCAKHRLPETHSCDNLRDCRQELFEKNSSKLRGEKCVADKV